LLIDTRRISFDYSLDCVKQIKFLELQRILRFWDRKCIA